MLNLQENILDLSVHPFAVFSAEGSLLYENKIFASLQEVIINENDFSRNAFLLFLAEIACRFASSDPISIYSNKKFYEFFIHKNSNSTFVI